MLTAIYNYLFVSVRCLHEYTLSKQWNLYNTASSIQLHVSKWNKWISLSNEYALEAMHKIIYYYKTLFVLFIRLN